MKFQFRSQRSFTRNLTLLVIILWLSFIVTGVSAGESQTHSRSKSPAGQAADSAPAAVSSRNDSDHAVCLFTLHNGVCTPRYFSRSQLAQGEPLEIQGYVVGVVVFGSSDLQVELGGQKFRPVQPNADGTFNVRGYGRFDPAELSARTHTAVTGQKLPAATIEPPPGGPAGSALYYFPKVFGAAVSPQPQFELQLADRDTRRVVEVRHRPVQQIAWIDDERPAPSSAFYYVGHRLDTLIESSRNFQGRLAAIYGGIRLVEDAFELDLVQDVQLIDLLQRNNALTYDGRNTIWFYIDTVIGTSPQELLRMAGHETIHQLVYQLRLAHHSQTRRFFADLWGLDKLSMARFQLVTTGWFDSRNNRTAPENSLFFSFINEKNFMRGMNGGHSHDNLDEFLTSFIHSLLHIEKLKRNLNAPVRLYGSNARHRMTEHEKDHVLSLYAQTLDLLQQTAQAASSNGSATFIRFLEERQAVIQQVKADRENSRPATAQNAQGSSSTSKSN